MTTFLSVSAVTVIGSPHGLICSKGGAGTFVFAPIDSPLDFATSCCAQALRVEGVVTEVSPAANPFTVDLYPGVHDGKTRQLMIGKNAYTEKCFTALVPERLDELETSRLCREDSQSLTASGVT